MPERPLVCIDPGHGGRFPGAQGVKYVEKVLTLELALRLREALVNEVETVLTREEDEDLAPGIEGLKSALRKDLEERCRICNEADSDLFISLHYNSFRLPTAHGFEVLHFTNSAKGRRLADLISQQFNPVGQSFGVRNRGVKPRENLYVLKHTKPPAVIVEAGFISNPDEEAIVASADYQMELAGAIRLAILDYLK
jgi:N-acetylmuramoyl-L-alanine amidase